MSKTEKIAQLNDQFRRSLGYKPEEGKVLISIKAKNHLCIRGLVHTLETIRDFESFNEQDDQNGDRSAGSLYWLDQKIHWIIAYFDNEKKVGSLNPADPDQTHRVLIITLGGEHEAYLSKMPI